MRPLRFAGVLGLLHGVMDTATGFAFGSMVFGAGGVDISAVGVLLIGYNTIAFGLQPVVGLFVDRYKNYRGTVRVGVLLGGVGLACVAVQPYVGFALLAVGSALFHVAGGAMAAAMSPRKSIAPALFTAPGVVGLGLGFVAGTVHLPLMLPLVVVLAVLNATLGTPTTPKALPPLPRRFAAVVGVLALLAAVMLRSTEWTAVVNPRYTLVLVVCLAVAAGLGKIVGGYVADRAGNATTIFASLALAALSFANPNLSRLGLVLGVFFLQMSTPIILAEVVARFPKRPATASGLVLGLAILLGGIIALGTFRSALPSSDELIVLLVYVTVCTAAGLWLVRRK
ncbi:MAG: hypothetical protein AAB663_02970 [Patescibacteria group bacterium]